MKYAPKDADWTVFSKVLIKKIKQETDAETAKIMTLPLPTN